MPVEHKMQRRAPRGNSGRFKIKQETIAAQQADLLRQVRARDGLSRIDLARSLNLAPSTVGIYVDHLVEEGFLFEGKPAARDFGRPPTILALNPQGGRFIGVDFEARNIMAVATDFAQRRLKEFHDTIVSSDSLEGILQKIEHAIETVSAHDSRKLLGIGVGVPGVIDLANGVALAYKHIKGWENVPLVSRLNDRFKTPVYLENNIRTMALAELWFGQGRSVRNFICVGVRSGVGAGIIIDGQIYHGTNNRAGEIGDWPCAPANCGNRDGGSQSGMSITRLEDVVAFRRVWDRLSAVAPSRPDSVAASRADAPWQALVQGAEAGDETVLQVLDQAAQTFGLVLSQLNCAFNPEKIILAGVLTAFGDLFLRRLEKTLESLAFASAPPKVVNSTLGEFNGAIGAAALAVHEWIPLPNQS